MFPSANEGQLAYAPPSHAVVEGACVLSTEYRYNSGVGQVLTQKKRAYIGLVTGKDILTQVISPAQTVRALHLLVRKCSRPKAHSYVTEWGQKTACIFPNTTSYHNFRKGIKKLIKDKLPGGTLFL